MHASRVSRDKFLRASKQESQLDSEYLCPRGSKERKGSRAEGEDQRNHHESREGGGNGSPPKGSRSYSPQGPPRGVRRPA